MARPLRIEFEGAVYHVTARGNERKKIFFSRIDYNKFIQYLTKAKKKFGILIHSYVLMGNHYHLNPVHMLYFFMGEKSSFESLTKKDKTTVVIYRTGIFLSTVIICISALIAVNGIMRSDIITILLLMLYLSVGLSVFFIHLYIGKFHRILKKIYYAAVVCLILLFIIGKGNPAVPLFSFSIGLLSRVSAGFGLGLIAAMLVFFTLRKVFMPMHYDIGDKSAYQP